MVSYGLVLKKSEGTSNAYVGSPVMSRCGENKRSIVRLRIDMAWFVSYFHFADNKVGNFSSLHL